MTKADDENFKMFKNRLKEIVMYYVESKGADEFESLIDVMLMEQFVNSIPKNVRFCAG